jgi:hypothetical protein
MTRTGTISYVSMAALEVSAERERELQDALDAERKTLEQQIVAAHAAGAHVSRIAEATGRSRPKIYTVLHRHGVELDAEKGRRLVRHRWTDRPDRHEPADNHGSADESALERFLSTRRGDEPDQPELFDPPADAPAEPEMTVLEFIAARHADQSAAEAP